MKLLSTFYSRGGDLAAGWWARIESTRGRCLLRFLWQDAAGPDFDDLAALVADLDPDHDLDEALQLAREDSRLVRRTKPVTLLSVDGEGRSYRAHSSGDRKQVLAGQTFDLDP